MTQSHFVEIAPRTSKLMLWTERGAARHAKMLDTDKAWEVFEALEDNYFNKPHGHPPQESSKTLTPANQRRLRKSIEARAKYNPKEYKAIYNKLYLTFDVAKYDQIPDDKIELAIIAVNSMALEGELLPKNEPSPVAQHHYHYPKSAIKLAYKTAEPGWMTYRNLVDENSSHLLQDLLNQLEQDGYDVSGARFEYDAMRYLLETQNYHIRSIKQHLSGSERSGLRLQ